MSRSLPAEACLAASLAIEPKIRLRGVSQRFGATDQSVLALEGADLEVRAGEFVAVVGESGCGKTTLLRLIAGLLEPSAGRVELSGRPVCGPSPEVAIVFQRPVLLEWRSVLDNVLLPIELARLPRAEHELAARELVRTLGLAGFEQKRPRQLSGGMHQRVALARALIAEPTVLLLDEPFGALDAITREQLQLELLRVWTEAGATALLVTHDTAEAIFLADRVALMSPRPGRIARLVEVPLPRPRAIEQRYEPEFARLCRDLRRALFEEARD